MRISFFKFFIVGVQLILSSLFLEAQIPGGLDTTVVGQMLWMKANSATGVQLDLSSTYVIEWQDESSPFSVTQASTANAPYFVDDDNTVHQYNFNPYLEFESTSNRKLVNTSAAENFYGTNGSYFVVADVITGSGSLLTYRSSNGVRIQAKPSFRLQNGVSGVGYTSDFGAYLSTSSFSTQSARVITSINIGTATEVSINSYGFPVNNTSTLYYPAIQNGMCLGANTNSEYYNDAIAELIIFPTPLNPVDANKVESYLALKYGITLDSSTSSNYTLSDNTVAWPAANHPNFHHRITGIARDDGSDLYQKQSRSVHNGLQVTAYCGEAGPVFPMMNADNLSQVDDMQYMIFGDDDLSTDLKRCTAGDYIATMERTWIVRQSVDFDTSVTLSVPKSEVPDEVKNILVSADPFFPINASTVYPLFDDGTSLYAEVLLGDSLFFTFASDSVSTTYTVTPSYCVIPSGTATAASTDGGGNYSYIWNTAPSQNIPTAVNLSPGSITLSILHGEGCVVTEMVAISSATYDLNVTDVVEHETCGNRNASITISENGSGTPTYLYSIDGGATLSTSPVFTGLDAGGYQIYVVDGNGCTGVLYTAIVDNLVTAPEINYSFIEPLCHGDMTASVQIDAIEVFPPYTYSLPGLSLSNGDGFFENLFADTYTFHIVDANNCHLDTSITVTEPSELVISTDLEPSCWLFPTGRATLNSYGGTPDYTYSSDGIEYLSENLLDSLTAGPHTFFVQDVNGCIDSTSVDLDMYPEFSLSYEVSDIECIAWNTGHIGIIVEGETSPYTFTWREFPDEIIGDTKSDLYPGDYHITVQDVNMCTDTVFISLDNNCCRPFVPNAFTPNSDGTNDFLEVHKSPDMELLKFEIYNRFGEQIFLSLDQYPIWDGRYKGQNVDIGTYMWKATMICTQGEEIATGDFHVLR